MNFKTYLENRFLAFECLEPKKIVVHHGNSSKVHDTKSFLVSNGSLKCEFCSEIHKLCFGKRFSKQNVDFRREYVRKHNICFNCLGSNDNVYSCKKPTTCRICNRMHHSLLHPETAKETIPYISSQATAEATNSSASASHLVSCISTSKVNKSRHVLLATALVKAESVTGEYQIVRALID